MQGGEPPEGDDGCFQKVTTNKKNIDIMHQRKKNKNNFCIDEMRKMITIIDIIKFRYSNYNN